MFENICRFYTKIKKKSRVILEISRKKDKLIQMYPLFLLITQS